MRHGSHDELGSVVSGRSEIGLNAQGWREARQAAELLRSFGGDVVYCSPRTRTVQTAIPIAKLHNGVMILVDSLDEIDFGSWTGRRLDGLKGDPHWDLWNADRDHARVPDGEAMADVRGRIVAFLDALAEKAGSHLCVTHGDVIRSALAHYDGRPQSAIFDYRVDPGSVTVLEAEDGVLRVTSINSTRTAARPQLDA